MKIDSGCSSLLRGLWAYGRRLLVHGENSENCCRGSCYWMIDQHLKNPEVPLEELAKAFEEGAPQEAVDLHFGNLIPAGVVEEKLWSQTGFEGAPPLPNRGIHTLLVGFSTKEGKPCKAHRIARIGGYLFDPNTGLSIWDEGDLRPLLERIGKLIRTTDSGFFTIEGYSYRKQE